MHYTQVKGILSAQNGMNLYRGCSHGCIYCDSRSKCYHIDHEFEDIEVKQNALDLLEKALIAKRKKCMIGTGAMTDPYIPLESSLRYVRGAMELCYKYGFGFTLQTKSDRVLQDIDLLQKINNKTKCVVQMTLTTFDEELCKKIEPNVSTTKERFDALCAFADAGIPTVVWLSPILPFINDTEANLVGIMDYCVRAKVWGIINFGMGLTLREGNREYYYAQLDKLFPGLKQKYIQTYGNAYEIGSPNGSALMLLFRDICRRNGIECDVNKVFAYLHAFEQKGGEQLSLWD